MAFRALFGSDFDFLIIVESVATFAVALWYDLALVTVRGFFVTVVGSSVASRGVSGSELTVEMLAESALAFEVAMESDLAFLQVLWSFLYFETVLKADLDFEVDVGC